MSTRRLLGFGVLCLLAWVAFFLALISRLPVATHAPSQVHAVIGDAGSPPESALPTLPPGLSADWMGVWVNLAMAVLTFLIVVFNGAMWWRLTRKSTVSIDQLTPENFACIAAQFSAEPGKAKAYFFRLPVRATGIDAKNVQVFALDLQSVNSERPTPITSWIPSGCCWVWSQRPIATNVFNIDTQAPTIHEHASVVSRPVKRGVQPVIPHGSRRWCTLGFVLDPKVPPPSRYRPFADPPHNDQRAQLWLTLMDEGHTHNNVHLPGRYRLTIEVTATNADTTQWWLWFELKHVDQWPDSPRGALSQMLIVERLERSPTAT